MSKSTKIMFKHVSKNDDNRHVFKNSSLASIYRMVEAITFSELRNIQKQEKDNEELVELEDNFVLKVAGYLTAKEEIGEEREYRNAKRIFDQIMNLRRRKVTKNAIIHAKTDMDPSQIDLLPEEQKLFRELTQKFRDHIEKLDDKLESEGNESEIDQGAEKEDSEGERGQDDKTKVKIKSQVPEFMGTDLESYGPFEKGEEPRIPEDNAEILVNRGNAEMIE